MGEAGEFRRGWPVLLASMLGIGLGLSPLAFYTLGVFAPHLRQAFGWTIGDVLAGITVQTVAVAVLAPFAGMLTTRFGPRPVALGSLVLFSFAFMSFALSNGSLTLFYATWVAQAVFGLGTLPITWTRVINQRFEAHRGLALGLALMGTGLFGFLSKPLTRALIDGLGWRGAYVALGLMPLLLAAPVAFACFRERPSGRLADAAPAPVTGVTAGQAFRQWRFWLLAIALLLISFGAGGPIPNMENILKTHGFSAGGVTGLTSLIGLSAIAGRLLGGLLLDLVWAPAVAAAILSLPAASCWLLSRGAIGYGEAAAAICMIGFAVGVEYDLLAYLVVKYFGLRGYPTIYGAIYVSFGLGAGFGPFLFGRSFDANGSYDPVLHLAFVLLLVGAASLLALGRYPALRREPDGAASYAGT